jgi:DNA repair protein RadA/Sms
LATRLSVNTNTCSACGGKIAEGKYRCTSCGHWQFSHEYSSDGYHDEINDGSVLFEDIQSSAIDRVSIGLLDDCLDGGLVRSDVVLIGGGPGAGKSTLMLQTAEAFCAYGETLYIAAEEDIKTIKARGERLGIKTHRQLRFLPALSGVANIGALLMARRPKFIIADSIDALSGNNDAEEILILTIIKKYCVELQAPAIIISQVNKGGDYAGLKEKQHAVDVLLTFDVDEDGERNDIGELPRVLETIKNRSGRAYRQSYFEMTGQGLVLTLGPEDSQNDSDENSEGDSNEDDP